MGKNIGFFIKGLVFIIPLALLMALVEARLTKVPNNYNLKRKYFEAQAKSTAILVLGSSQSLYGIDPDSFPVKGFNLANVSQDLYYDLAITNRYLDSMPNLKVVVIPISYFSLYYEMKNSKTEDWRMFFYHHFWNIDNDGMSKWDSKYYSKYMLYTPFTSLEYLVTDSAKIKIDRKVQYDGYLPNTGTYKVSEQSGKAWVALHNKATVSGKSKLVEESLEATAKRLTEKNIKIIFITIPVFHTYYDYCDTGVLRENDRSIMALCKTYHAGYYDYLKDTRFLEADFADDDHLNPLGAAKFSNILSKEALVPNLKK